MREVPLSVKLKVGRGWPIRTAHLNLLSNTRSYRMGGESLWSLL